MLVSILMAAAVAASPPSKADAAGIDATIRGVYEIISGPPGQKRDFDKMRSMFAPNALLRVITPDRGLHAIDGLITGLHEPRASHLDLLEAASLVVTQKRGREKLHYLNPVPIHEIQDRWIGKFDIDRYEQIVRLTVTQERFASDDDYEASAAGWPAVMANLKSLLETGHVLPQAPWTMSAELRNARLR